MSRSSGELEFEFLDDGTDGSFVATGKAIPMLTGLLAKGSVEEAMRLYEGCDATVAAELLSQTKTMSSISLKNLAAMFVMARDFRSGAVAFETGKKYAEAAKLYEQAGDFPSAAKCFLHAGEEARAAAAFERAGKPESALEIHQKLGPSEAMAECMVRQHLYFDAAGVYRHLKNLRGEVESLRMVPIDSPKKVSAVKRLAELMEQNNHHVQAIGVLTETLQKSQTAQGDPDLIQMLVRLLEQTGRHEHAEKVRGFARKVLGGGAGAVVNPVPQAPQPKPVNAASPSGPRPVHGQVLAPPPRSAPAGPHDPFATLVDPFGGGARANAQVAAPNDGGYGQLKAIPIFGELALPDMKDLFRIADPINYPANFVIIEQAVKGHGLVVILEGTIQVVKVDGGKNTVLATLGPGAYVGELALVDDAPTSARVVAQTPVRAVVISKERFAQYLYAHESAAGRIYKLFTRTLAERLRTANKRSS